MIAFRNLERHIFACASNELKIKEVHSYTQEYQISEREKSERILSRVNLECWCHCCCTRPTETEIAKLEKFETARGCRFYAHFIFS